MTSTLTIRGAGDAATVLDGNGVGRLIHVAATGTLTLERLTLQGGSVVQDIRVGSSGGGGIFSKGMLIVSHSALTDNHVVSARAGRGPAFGGGIFNDNGILIVSHSALTDNTALSKLSSGGGIYNASGTVTIMNSALAGNTATGDGDCCGGGLYNNSATSTVTLTDSAVTHNTGNGIWNTSGSVIIANSTVAGNTGIVAGIHNSIGTVTLTNSTVAANNSGIDNGGTVTLLNTILTLNTASGTGSNCSGSITSLGTNLLGDLTGCTLTLLPTDRTGDPGLGPFTDDGIPGHGHFPLLPGSPAIDAGNNAACPATDQLGMPRPVDGNGDGTATCDIGAIEFFPIVNDLVTLLSVRPAFDRHPVPQGPAGTFTITATFRNTGATPLLHPFFEVIALSGGNVLRNADGGAGSVGATLTPDVGAAGLLAPGDSLTVDFAIGLQAQSHFTFFVDLFGVPSP